MNPSEPSEGVRIFSRDAVGVLKRQLEKASSSARNFLFTPVRGRSRTTGEPVRTHPMSGDLPVTAYHHMKEHIMSSSDVDTYWHEGKSFPCFYGLYSDKSAMTISIKAHVFTPFTSRSSTREVPKETP